MRPENKLAIDSAIDELHFTVNLHARGLKTKRSMTVGAVIPDFQNLFINTIMNSASDLLRKHGYALITVGCHSNADEEEDAVKFLMSKQVDAIMNMPISQLGTHLAPAVSANIPIVMIDRTINALRTRASSVLVDNVGISARAVQTLLDAGHTKIGIVAGPEHIFTSQQRLLGYKQAHMQSGLMPDPGLVIYGDYNISGGHDAVKQLVSRGATAIFTTNYEMTLGAVVAINELGIKIPEQLSFIGFDNMQIAEVIRPRLTIVAQPLEQMGERAAKIIIARLEAGSEAKCETVMMPAEIILGDSVAAPGIRSDNP